ncbi:MAG: hypothetical protein QG652_896 [Pseudomonadota bacterium]|nr:hypothetical protein [Pseudomonadota bacterium]
MNKVVAILPNNFWSVMLSGLLFFSAEAVAAPDALIEQAHQLDLEDNPAWLNLIHMRSGFTGVNRSEVADPQFFLSVNGRMDAEAELDATVRAFSEDSAMACRFPARWHWLSRFLDMGTKAECAELDSWKQKLAAQHLTLLFPSMYLQNPASMFGHTFLRFDQNEKSPLLAYTLSYAARPDTQDNVLSYVYKGVFGGYPGVFAVQPYYQTVTDYGDIEHRDIREYSLNLDSEEIDQLLNHVWELRDKQIDYYFLRENCAFQLLSLLDVARPGMQLTQDRFLLYAIPVDTVRSVRDAGLIESSAYRPARASRIAQMYVQLDAPLQTLAMDCAERTDCQPSSCTDCRLAGARENKPDYARVLELATEIRQLWDKDAQALLSQRSQLIASANWQPFSNPDPQDSHDSARWHFAAGKHEQQRYAEFGLRPALHDWLDDDSGLIEGAELEVLSLRVRYYPEADYAQLQQLKIFGMQSYSPVQPWQMPLSSEINLGMYRISDEKVFYAEGGLGLSAKVSVLHFFALADLEIETAPQGEPGEAAYLGVHAGVRGKIFSGRLLLDGKWQNGFAGYEETRKLFNAGYQWDVSRRYALRMEYMLRRSEILNERDIRLGLAGYF